MIVNIINPKRMKPTQLIFILFTILLGSCRDQIPEVEQSVLMLNQNISIDGIEREYHIQVPNDATNKPLVLLLHGHGGSHKQSIGADGTKAPQKVWLTLADENEFILVIPNGLLGPEDSRGWNDCRDDAVGNPESDDVKFLSELLDEVEEEYDYDVNRTYVTGISNGAMMTLRLAHEIPNKITAFGAIVNSMAANSKCNDSDIAISALFMNGTEDPLVPYDGGQIASNRGEVISTDESINYWIARNNT
jgi:polyhydroxybutyrate depolymerase